MTEPAQAQPARDGDTPSGPEGRATREGGASRAPRRRAGKHSEPEGRQAPAFAIVRGSPSAEEVAALAVVLARRGALSADATYARRVRSEWSARSRLLRAPLQRGPGGWRASARPR